VGTDRSVKDVGLPVEGAVLDDRYLLQERAGAGGMGVVHRGWDQVLRRPVAIKLLPPVLAGHPELRRRFLLEARAAAGLTSPAVVAVFDHGEDVVPYLVMEFVDGPSLRAVLHVRGRLPAAEALTVVEAVSAALGEAHGRGIVHRDVKPENVLLGRDGSTVKLADFGLARVLGASQATDGMAVLGTARYLAPELLAGGSATPASDQFALGVLLAEMVAGAGAPQPLAALVPRGAGAGRVGAVDGPLGAVVARATARDPADRYPGSSHWPRPRRRRCRRRSASPCPRSRPRPSPPVPGGRGGGCARGARRACAAPPRRAAARPASGSW